MYYEPGLTEHGLSHDPFKSCVVPRPIGWISTRSVSGKDNLAPYSQFTNVSFDPAMVMFSSNQTTTGERKDTVINAEQTGVFIWNMATYALREAVNLSAQELPYGEDEFKHAHLEKIQGTKVNAPRVALSPIQFECEYIQTVRLPGNGTMGTVDVVFGKVIGIHISDEIIDPQGKIDILKARPIARMGYFDYTTVDSKFEMVIPNSDRLLIGLEGAAARNK